MKENIVRIPACLRDISQQHAKLSQRPMGSIKTLTPDTETLYHRILKDICAKYGKMYTNELKLKNFGATDLQVCKNVVNDLQLKISADDLTKELRAITDIKLPKAPLREGAERLLKHLTRFGVLLALATNSTLEDVKLHMTTKPEIFGMFHHMMPFAYIFNCCSYVSLKLENGWADLADFGVEMFVIVQVCSGDPGVARGKPHPDPYLAAADKFPDKPPPAKCLVFEDSLVGLTAGLAAGMQVVIIPPQNLPTRDCAAATLVLRSLQEFKPELFGLPPFT